LARNQRAGIGVGVKPVGTPGADREIRAAYPDLGISGRSQAFVFIRALTMGRFWVNEHG
jgi:hypothetical protein